MPPLWQWDQDIFRAIHVGLHRVWLDPLMVAITFTGLGYPQIAWLLLAIFRRKLDSRLLLGLIFGVAVALGFVEKSPLAFAAALLGSALVLVLRRPVAACALWALILSGALRIAVVPLVGRQRPSNFEFATPLEDIHGFSSFPSGHTTTTFAIATVVTWCCARTEESWLAWTTVAWACLVGFSRIYVGVHYPLDVIAGAAFGIGVGSALYWFWQSKGWFDQAMKPIERNLS